MFCELGEEMFGTGCLHQSTKVFVAYHQYPLTTVSSAENVVVFEMKFYFLAFHISEIRCILRLPVHDAQMYIVSRDYRFPWNS